MITSVITMPVPLFYDGHGLKIFFLPGLVGEPGITPGLFNITVPQQHLETLQAHADIKKLCGESVTKGVQGIPLSRLKFQD